MRRRARIAAGLVGLWAVAVLAAQSVPSPASLKPSGFVNDYAHVLQPDAAAALEQRARLLNQQLKVQVAMVTVASTGDTDTFDYSLQLAQQWGIGSKIAANGQDKDTGLLVFIAVKDHKYYTQVGYGLEPYITDADVGSWMRDLRPQLQGGDFGVVFGGMLDQIERTLAARMPGAADRLGQLPAAPARGRGQDNSSSAGQLGWLGFLLLIWIVGALASRGRGGGMGGCLWPLIFMNMGGGGYRGGGGWGGGFGGMGGGGGGFGGFGGGGFGGGGAGGSW